MLQAVLITTAALLFVPHAVLSQSCPYSSYSTCITTAVQAINQLSQSDAAYYCKQGAIIAATASKCLVSCNGVDVTHDLATAARTVNQFCGQASPGCSNVVEVYLNQTQCFDPYGGAAKAANDILTAFNNSYTTNCNPAIWGRNCQKLYTTCQYNYDLGVQLLSATPQIVVALAVCGSETLVTPLLPLVTDNSKCSSSLYTTIEAQCNVATAVPNANSNGDMCTALQTQLQCILTLSAGCTTAVSRYVLPRLESYAIANIYLGCSLTLFNILIKPSPLNRCNYINQINSCFYSAYTANAFNLIPARQLLNRDLPLRGFCNNRQSVSAGVLNCTLSLFQCTIPQAQLLTAPTTFDDSYAPAIGVFPLNSYGMTSLFNSLPASCATNTGVWSIPIVAAQTTAPGPSGGSGVKQSGPTPARQKTPPPPSRPTTPRK
jgi:hypothetical protein